MRLKNIDGFTLVELMIIVAIIGILAAVVSPRFNSMIQTSKDADVKSKLGIIRSALNIYYANNLANFPVGPEGSNQTTLQDTLVPKYLQDIPPCYVYPHHEKTTFVDNISTGSVTSVYSACDGKWVYVSNQDDSNWGEIHVKCFHRDRKGSIWVGY